MGTFITCAVTGGADTVSRHPRIPVTPKEIADAAISASKAGAAIVHLHARDPHTGQQSRDPELFAEIVSLIRDSDTDVIINVSCGMAGDLVLTEMPDSQLAGPGTDLLGPRERLQHVGCPCQARRRRQRSGQRGATERDSCSRSATPIHFLSPQGPLDVLDGQRSGAVRARNDDCLD